MSVWQHGNKIPDPAILAAAASDDPGCGKVFNFADCRLKHLHQKERERRGLRNEYEPCAYCEKIMKALAEAKPPVETQNEENIAMSKEPKTNYCEKCSKPLTKNGHCLSCLAKGKNNRWKNHPKNQQTDIPDVGTCPEPEVRAEVESPIPEETVPGFPPQPKHTCPGCGIPMWDSCLCVKCFLEDRKRQKEEQEYRARQTRMLECRHIIGISAHPNTWHNPEIFIDAKVLHEGREEIDQIVRCFHYCPLCGKKLVLEQRTSMRAYVTQFEEAENAG